MAFIKKTWVFLLLFLIPRLIFIANFPPFTDESNHIRFGLLAISSPNFVWAPVTYWNKLPLPYWLFGLGTKLGDFLIGPRLMQLMAAVIAFGFLYSLVSKIFGEKAAKWSLLIYALTPAFIFFQSLATMDGLEMSLGIILLDLIFRFKESNSWKISGSIGAILGIAIWIKLYALTVTGISALLLIFFLRTKKLNTENIRIFLCFILSFTGVLLPIIFIPQWKNILRDPGTYTFSLQQLLGFPWQTWVQNLLYLSFGILVYFSPVVLFGLLLVRRIPNRKLTLPFWIWFLLPTIYAILVCRLFTMRYMLYASVGLIPLMGLGMEMLEKKLKKDFLIWGVIIMIGLQTTLLVFQTENFFGIFRQNRTTLSESDYLYGFSGGTGTKKLVDLIEEKRQQRPLIIGVADSPGNPSDYVLGYYFKNPSVHVIFLSGAKDFLQAKPQLQNLPVYYIIRNSRLENEVRPYLNELVRFDQVGHEDYVGLYQVDFSKVN